MRAHEEMYERHAVIALADRIAELQQKVDARVPGARRAQNRFLRHTNDDVTDRRERARGLELWSSYLDDFYYRRNKTRNAA